MSELMSLLLQRLEIEPASLGHHDFPRHVEPDREHFERGGILRPSSPAASLDCWDCGSTHCCSVTYLNDQRTDSRRGYIHCPLCGIQEIDLRRTERWSIDVPTLLQASFGKLIAGNSSISPLTERLWRVGRINLAGRSRDVYFKRHGWRPCGENPDGNQHWTRPGKQKGTSATLKDGTFYVFSSNAHPFESNVAYTAFGVFALLEHEGDFDAAARALSSQG